MTVAIAHVWTTLLVTAFPFPWRITFASSSLLVAFTPATAMHGANSVGAVVASIHFVTLAEPELPVADTLSVAVTRTLLFTTV